MKVVLVCHSDLLGGASVVTFRLMQALRHCGIDARMIVYTKLSDNPDVVVVGTRFTRGLRFCTERLRIFMANGFSREHLFKVSIADHGEPLYKHPWVLEADVVALNWINQGLLSLDGIQKISDLGKPIVWTMHDVWNATGICHHAYECRKYEEECGKCPFLGERYANDLSHKIWKRKSALYASAPIHFVAVSNWLAGVCSKSSLLAGRHVEVIPNAFPIDSFTTEAPTVLPPGVDTERDIILMGAARLDDHVKGLNYAIEALNYIFDTRPDIARRATAVFFGDIRNPEILDSLRFSYTWLGRINDPHTLRSLYAAAKVVLSTSLYETLPGTLIEGQAAGCLPVTFGRGGQTDIVTHLKDGYIARYRDAKDVAAGIEWALNAEVNPLELHESVRQRFAASLVARRYIDLFNQVIAERKAETEAKKPASKSKKSK